MNSAVLSGNDPINQISNRYNPKDLIPIEDRQMAHAMDGHELHAFLDGMAAGDVHNVPSQDFLHGGLLGGFSFERDLASVIPFSENPDQFFMFGNQQRPDILVGHQLDRLEDRGLGRNAPDGVAFMAEDFVNRANRIHD